jgi:hypothetical protein
LISIKCGAASLGKLGLAMCELFAMSSEEAGWQPLADGALVVARDGELFARIVPAPPEPIAL